MIELNHVSKTFTDGDRTVEALKDVTIRIEDGDIYGIIGMSGAGKSTLVRCINMLERPTEGDVLINGASLAGMPKSELRLARRRVAMIFQGFNLLMQRTCLDNICFPLRLAGVSRRDARAKAEEMLALVGLPDKRDAYPAQLSGGQKQRIAIARALATDPEILLCDEATSALDPKTTLDILSLIKDINVRFGITVVIITHQMSVVEQICNRVTILDAGRVAEQGDVSEVFACPKSAAARRLVFPDSAEFASVGRENERTLRVVFNGAASAGEPLIARMALEEKILANILYASTRTLDGRVYGNMLLGVPDEPAVVERALAFLSGREHIQVVEVEKDAE